ncbi:hypothetical protein [Actinomarinicola tropica]|uniref:Uncharacterized protein n=1 Tax=Actinomarinicola tropica TaxID=2789776 RepID=A0A5Q2RMC5_9ACTN|nr:hypothetical protein [Actinomarinicola tropica]QGG95576.1 hypothetical protein GH723_10985 [Actinomarinicola tropica]
MRILRLDLEDGEELDLHPYVTVLGGLDPDVHRRVVDRLVRLTRGDAAGTSGLIESDEVLSELSSGALAALDLPPDTEVLVRAEQLPGARLVGAGGSDTDADARLSAARAALAELEDELTAARRAVATATNQLDEARRGVDDFAINAHDAAVAAVREAEAAAVARLQGTAATDERVRLESALAEAREAAARHEARLDAERLALLELLEDLEAARAEHDQLSADDAAEAAEAPTEPDLPVVPPAEHVAAVEQALELVRMGPPPAPMVTSPEALDLADRIREHNERHDALEQTLRDEGIDVVALQDELSAAQFDVQAAQEAARPKVISPEDDAEIERLHDIVVDLGEKRSSRRSGKSTESAYQEACDALDAILDRVGYPTYAAYVMGRIAPTIDVDARRRLDAATDRVADLEGQLDQAASILERDARVLMLRAERDQLWAAARDLLATLPDDVESALRALRVPAESDHPAVDELRALLDRLGIDRRGDDERTLVGAAETFLADAALARSELDARRAADDEVPVPVERPVEAAARRVDDLHARAATADAALAELEDVAEEHARRVAEVEAALDALAASAPADPAQDPRVAQDPAVRGAHEQLAVAEARLARHRDAVALADELQGRLRSARSAEREVQARHDDAAHAAASLEEEVTGGPPPEVEWNLDDAGVEPIEWFLLGRVATLRTAAPSGTVPLVLDDAFRGLSEDHVESLCAALAKVARTVQILYVGDTPAVAAWARAQGLDVAAVVRPGQPAI